MSERESEREGDEDGEGERERGREGEGEQEGVEVREGNASKDLAAGLVSSSTEVCLVAAKGFSYCRMFLKLSEEFVSEHVS